MAQVQSSADQGKAKPEGKVRTDDARHIERSEPQKGQRAERSRTRGRESDFSTDWKHRQREPARMAGFLCALTAWAEMPVDVPRRRDHDHGAERQVKPNRIALCAHNPLKELDADHDPGPAGEKHPSRREPVNLAAPDLHGNHDELD